MQVSCVYAVAIGKPHFGNVSAASLPVALWQACVDIHADLHDTYNDHEAEFGASVALQHPAVVKVHRSVFP